jgi:hypothetical protein
MDSLHVEGTHFFYEPECKLNQYLRSELEHRRIRDLGVLGRILGVELKHHRIRDLGVLEEIHFCVRGV